MNTVLVCGWVSSQGHDHRGRGPRRGRKQRLGAGERGRFLSVCRTPEDQETTATKDRVYALGSEGVIRQVCSWSLSSRTAACPPLRCFRRFDLPGHYAPCPRLTLMLAPLFRTSCPGGQLGHSSSSSSVWQEVSYSRVAAPSRSAPLFHLSGADYPTRPPSWVLGVTELVCVFLPACLIGGVVIVPVFAWGSGDVGTPLVWVIWAYLGLGFDRVPFSAPERRATRAASSAAGHAPSVDRS
ncbi:hypothetical protein NDU88_002188 [Pleurodeles waltl]|uniref:Uncharacterized protein n=1 Tax=Pleurodeles waltl TaxID=8319 RepID=A0AAV7T252_PLEWA|nr:hypothetical protein NDU88_002188 [Pleurodeles waltl]